MLSQYNRSILSIRRQELLEQLGAEKSEILKVIGNTHYLNNYKMKALEKSIVEIKGELAELEGKLK